jgi:hypothetical protein
MAQQTDNKQQPQPQPHLDPSQLPRFTPVMPFPRTGDEERIEKEREEDRQRTRELEERKKK